MRMSPAQDSCHTAAHCPKGFGCRGRGSGAGERFACLFFGRSSEKISFLPGFVIAVTKVIGTAALLR